MHIFVNLCEFEGWCAEMAIARLDETAGRLFMENIFSFGKYIVENKLRFLTNSSSPKDVSV